MKNQAFTLIEVLIAVLIIGILAAIAVPQYQKAVEKNRAMQAIAVLRTVYQAAEAFELSTGQWPTDINQLDINIPGLGADPEWSIRLNRNDYEGSAGVSIYRKKGKYKGTKFAISKRPNYNFIPKDKILCCEQAKGTEPLFSGEIGSYCVKIFAGKPIYVSNKNYTNLWLLP